MWIYSHKKIFKSSCMIATCVQQTALKNYSSISSGRLNSYKHHIFQSKADKNSIRSISLPDNSSKLSIQHFYCYPPKFFIDNQNVPLSKKRIHSPEHFSNSELIEDNLDAQEMWNVGPGLKPAFNYAAYANQSDSLKKLIDLGVDLFKIEQKFRPIMNLVTMDVNTQLLPVIEFLEIHAGVPENQIGRYITKNPFIFRHPINNLEARINYLYCKKFEVSGVSRINCFNPSWLNFEVPAIDARLGYIQRFFKLSGEDVRKVTLASPKLITANRDTIETGTFRIKEEMGFNADEIKSLLISFPRLWFENHEKSWCLFDFLHNNMGLSHEALVKNPSIFGSRLTILKPRVEYLRSLGMLQLNPELPNFIPINDIYKGTDTKFAVYVAKSSIDAYNSFLKSL